MSSSRRCRTGGLKGNDAQADETEGIIAARDLSEPFGFQRMRSSNLPAVSAPPMLSIYWR
eukprot:4428100-Prymnesium_polylepis.1